MNTRSSVYFELNIKDIFNHQKYQFVWYILIMKFLNVKFNFVLWNSVKLRSQTELSFIHLQPSFDKLLLLTFANFIQY